MTDPEIERSEHGGNGLLCRGPRLSSFLGSRDNNFNLIRFICAFLVLFSHSYPLANGVNDQEPLFQLTGGLTFGKIAVYVFFITSGFLITASLTRRAEFISYFKARILRIYPALIVCVALCALLLGPLYTTLSLKEYFTSSLVYKFLVYNSLLEPFGIQYALPGVFEGLPYANAVNGSLWTLPHEIKAYVFLAIVYAVVKVVVKNERFFKYGVLASTVMLIAAQLVGKAGIVNVPQHLDLYILFMIGSSAFMMHDHIRLSYAHALLATAVAVGACVALPAYLPLILTLSCYVVLPYLIFVLAYLPGGVLRQFNKFGDYSYGIYIYAFPIQQLCAYYIAGISPTVMTLVASPFVLVLAIGSWHLIERPALKRVRRQPKPVPAEPAAEPRLAIES